MFNSKCLLQIQVAVMSKQLKMCMEVGRQFWARNVNFKVLGIKMIFKVIALDKIIKENSKDKTDQR